MGVGVALHEMSTNLLKRMDECLERLEMDLSSLSSDSMGVIESEPFMASRLHILAILTELDIRGCGAQPSVSTIAGRQSTSQCTRALFQDERASPLVREA